MDTARLPQVYLRCKDCVSIKLGGRYCPGPHYDHPHSPRPRPCVGNGVVGGCVRAVLSSFFIAAILLWEKDNVGFVLFYSVIYNSVVYSICSSFGILFSLADTYVFLFVHCTVHIMEAVHLLFIKNAQIRKGHIHITYTVLLLLHLEILKLSSFTFHKQ